MWASPVQAGIRKGDRMITSRLEESLDLTILTGSESVTTADVLRAMEEMYSGNPTKLVLWDFSMVDISAIDFEGVQAIAELAVKRGSSRRGGKTAIVTDQKIVLGITRVYESLVDGVPPLEQHVCDTIEEALEFLGIDELPAG